MNDMMDELKSFLLSQKDLLIKANDIDVKSGNDKMEISELENCFNYDNETRLYSVRLEGFADSQTKTFKLYDSLGTIGLDCKDNLIYPIAKVISLCVYTNNSLIINLKEGGKNYVTINMLVELVNKYLEAKEINIKIEVQTRDQHEFSLNRDLNKIFIISDEDYYLRNRYISDVETKFYLVDTPAIIVDNKAHIEYLKNIDKNVTVYTNEPLGISENERLVPTFKDAVRLVNRSEYRHKVILLTKDESNAKYFVNNCKVENVLVNVMDLSTRMPNFDQKDFLYIKTYQTIK